MNYDPNLTLCGRMADQTVKLTFGKWAYRKEMTVSVGGNCNGLSVIECAISGAYDQLPMSAWGDDDDFATIEMLEPETGNVLTCEDDECRGEDWLRDMLLAAEIIAITPQSSPEEENSTNPPD